MQSNQPTFDWQPSRKSAASREIARASQGHFVVSMVYGDELDGRGQTMHFESLLEYRAAICLLYRPDFASLKEQVGPIIWRAPWNTSDKPNRHTLDLLYTDRRGHRTAFIIKNFPATLRDRFQEGLLALRPAIVPHYADELCQVTERSIVPAELFNAELMHGVRHADPEADQAISRLTFEMRESQQVRDLIKAAGLPGRAFPAIVRALRQQTLLWDRSQKIAPSTLVSPQPHRRSS